MDQDRTDVEEALGGDAHAFNRIVGRYQRSLLRVAQLRLGDPQLAEDAVQETFLAAYKSLSTFNPNYRFQTWLWTILLNQCRRHGQKNQRRVQRETSSETPSDDLISTEECEPVRLAAQREQSQHLRELLDRLPEVQSEALRLRFFGGLKFPEIAEVMNCSLSSAKIRVRKGLEKISHWMQAAPESASLSRE